MNIVGCPVLNLVRTNQSFIALCPYAPLNIRAVFVSLLFGYIETPTGTKGVLQPGSTESSLVSILYCHLPATRRTQKKANVDAFSYGLLSFTVLD